MDDEKLITLVENNDILYNKFNKEYRTPDKKRAVWLRISKEMGVADELCMKRWSSLRDRYAKEKKNEKLASGSGASFRHRWQYMNQLEFLAPHVISRPVRSTINIVEQNSPTPIELTPSFHDGQTLNNSFCELQFEETQSLQHEAQNPSCSSPVVAPARRRHKRNVQFDESDEIFADAVETFKKFCASKEEKEKRRENDMVNAFGKMVCATLKSFNENKQARSMKLITDILTQLKLEPE